VRTRWIDLAQVFLLILVAARKVAKCTVKVVLSATDMTAWIVARKGSGRRVGCYGAGALDDSFVRQATTTSQMIHTKITT
jgi:hypothetical protein